MRASGSAWVVALAMVWTVAASALFSAQAGVPVAARDSGSQQTSQEHRIPVGASCISGTVIAADNGHVVQGARVSISGETPAPGSGGEDGQLGLNRSVTTDAGGHFTFSRLPAGTFRIYVSHQQFLQTNYGQTRDGGEPRIITLANGQQMALTVPMARGAVIIGAVFGVDGEPQRNSQVRASRMDMSTGFKRLEGQAYAQTDDRGMYRLFGLPPGDYAISATTNHQDYIDPQADLIEQAIASRPATRPSSSGAVEMVSVRIAQPTPAQQSLMYRSYLPTYAPSSVSVSGATWVHVSANEEQSGIDIRTQLTQASAIEATVSPPLEPGVSVDVALISDGASMDSSGPISTRVDSTGVVTFRAVAPGAYTLLAQTVAVPVSVTYINGRSQSQPPPVLADAQKMSARASLVVAGEAIISMNLALRPSRSVSGVLLFERDNLPDLSRSHLTVNVGPAPTGQPFYLSQPPQATVGPDGRFTVTGVPPGRFTIRVNGGGTLKSAMVDGQDALDFPFEVTGDRDITAAVLTLTNKPSELTGTLLDSRGAPCSDCSIIVAPSDTRYWTPGSRRIVLEQPNAEGRYSISNLPAGAYQVAVVMELERGAQYDPDFLRTIGRGAVPVAIVDGGTVTQDLRIR